MREKRVHQEFHTFRRLSVKQKIQYVWDYYRWRIIVLIFAIITITSFASMLWEGQKPSRLRFCAVLNTDYNCSVWFEDFEESHPKENAGTIVVNQDQPFDYSNPYYYIYEIEVMTTISSGRMDFAVCNADMYRYLLALNACLPLEENLPQELFDTLNDRKMLNFNTANLTEDEGGNIDLSAGIDGYYALDLSGTEFARIYNQTEEQDTPLYAVIISNTDNLEDCISLMQAIAE